MDSDLTALMDRWREEALGVDAMGYSQQADRMRDCADELAALLAQRAQPASSPSFDREQQRAGQVCGTCDEWKYEVDHEIVGAQGLCFSWVYNGDEPLTPASHSCAAWTPKEASDG